MARNTRSNSSAAPVAAPESAPVSPLVSAHADAIEKYGTATTAGVKAGAARRIAELELDMTLEGVEFSPWVRPSAVRTSAGPRMSAQEVQTTLENLANVEGDSAIAETIRATAHKRSQRIIKTYNDPYTLGYVLVEATGEYVVKS